jgi:hypothetical protein
MIIDRKVKQRTYIEAGELGAVSYTPPRVAVDSMWTPCGLLLNSLYIPYIPPGLHLDSLYIPCGLHQDSLWSPP